MRQIVFFALFMLAFPGSATAIVGGEAETGYDSVGAIVNGTELVCTGVLIEEQWGLTAASCFFEGDQPRTDGLEFCVGDMTSDCERATIDVVEVNERFDGTASNDIAVFHIADPIPGSEVALYNSSSLSVGTAFEWVGYGVNDPGGTGSGVRRIGNGSVAEVYLESFVSYSEPDSPCTGDIGAPAFRSDGANDVIGLVSSFDENCDAASLMTRVDALASWITDAVANTPIPCDLTGGDCPAGEACFLGNVADTCQPTDDLPLGAACPTDAGRLVCEDGSVCVPEADGSGGICTSFCDTDGDCAEGFCYLLTDRTDVGICGCTDDDADGFCADFDDCDDTDAAINPDADEICGNGIDEDCSGTPDDGCGDADMGTLPDMGSDPDVGANTDAGTSPTSSGAADDGGCCSTVHETGTNTPLWAMFVVAGLLIWRRRLVVAADHVAANTTE